MNTLPIHKFPYRGIIMKVVIFIFVIFLIVYFLPRDNSFNYQFSLNKPWKYGQLIATFDFPIYKDDALINKEQDSIMRLYKPYFVQDEEVQKSSLDKLREDYSSGELRNILPDANYIRHIEKLLREIYKAGVISTTDFQQLVHDSVNSIRVIENNIANPRNLHEVFTIREAYEYILNSDDSFKKEHLRRSSLNEYIIPNLIYDEQRNEIAKSELINNYSYATGVVQSGQKIIDRGEIIDEHTYKILESLRKESTKRGESFKERWTTLIGQTCIIASLILCLMIYLQLFRKQFYDHIRALSLLFVLVVVYSIVTSFTISNNLTSVYVIPFAIIPITIRVFLDSRTAAITHIITVLICSLMVTYPFEFILLQIPIGYISIFSLRELSQRSQLFKSAFLVALTYIFIYTSYELVLENDISKINFTPYRYFLVNGVLLLFTYPLLFALEKIFGFTSNVTLVELSNINAPLLRRMSETAPGTFQHSMQVANLAAEAAIRIGAKSQLVRTGALYHDIGKLENPAFFTENQQGGVNPHKNLNYEESAQIVIDHVRNGLKLAEKHNLPQAIKDFISTHHGKGITKFFYISWKNEHPGEEPDKELFTYPGPNPFTKETAILMMADSVEAASRSLPEYTEESIGKLVDKIIDTQVEEGYFKSSPITFKDIEIVKEVFKEKLMTSFHTRISYPELKKPANRGKRPQEGQ